MIEVKVRLIGDHMNNENTQKGEEPQCVEFRPIKAQARWLL